MSDGDRKLLKIAGIVLSIFSAIIFLQTVDSGGNGSFFRNYKDNFIVVVSFILFFVGLIMVFLPKKQ